MFDKTLTRLFENVAVRLILFLVRTQAIVQTVGRMDVIHSFPLRDKIRAMTRFYREDQRVVKYREYCTIVAKGKRKKKEVK